MPLYWAENGNNAIWFLCWWACYLVNYRLESHYADNNSPSFPLWWAERGFISSPQWPPLGSFGHNHVFLSKSHFGAIVSLLWLHRLKYFDSMYILHCTEHHWVTVSPCIFPPVFKSAFLFSFISCISHCSMKNEMKTFASLFLNVAKL